MGGIDWQCGIDTYSRNLDFSGDTISTYVECPECSGTGKDNRSLDGPCWKCKGLGSIRKEDE